MEITCRELPEVLADILGGEATVEQCAALERHAAGCSSCAASGAGLESILSQARATHVPEPPAGYWRSFLPELRTRIDRSTAHRRPRWLRWMTPLAAPAALAVATLLLVRPASRPATVATPSELADIRQLAIALDHLTPSDPLSALLAEPYAADDPRDDYAAAPTGDLFSFYELAMELSDEERNALFDEVAEDSRARASEG